MDDGARARAEKRRSEGMWGGVARSHEELDELDLDFWLAAAPEERVRAAWLIHEEVRLLRNDGPSPRLQRSIGGVRHIRR